MDFIYLYHPLPSPAVPFLPFHSTDTDRSFSSVPSGFIQPGQAYPETPKSPHSRLERRAKSFFLPIGLKGRGIIGLSAPSGSEAAGASPLGDSLRSPRNVGQQSPFQWHEPRGASPSITLWPITDAFLPIGLKGRPYRAEQPQDAGIGLQEVRFLPVWTVSMEGIDEMWMRSEPCSPVGVLYVRRMDARRRARRRSRYPSCGRPPTTYFCRPPSCRCRRSFAVQGLKMLKLVRLICPISMERT